MITLALDASTHRGTVAVLEEERVLVEMSAPTGARNAELLLPAVDKVLHEAGATIKGVDRIVCGAGPGSFTSLRIAASLAKGMAVARHIPLLAVSSLALIVAGNVTDGPRGARRYLAALDALRGQSYVQEFEHDVGVVRPVGEIGLLSTDKLASVAADVGARIVGPDQSEQWMPHARGVALLSRTLDDQGPVNAAQWEPLYGRMAEAQAKWEAIHGRALLS